MRITTLLLPLCLLLAGCSKKNAGPLAVEEIPAAIRKAFQSASDDVRKVSEGIAKQVERKQFAPAAMQLQTLMGTSGLNQEQKDVVARSLGTVNENLQQQLDMEQATVVPHAEAPAAAENNPAPPPQDASTEEAKEALRHYIRTK